MTRFISLWLLCFVVVLAGCGQREPAQQELVGDGSDDYPELRDRLDEDFQADISAALRAAVLWMPTRMRSRHRGTRRCTPPVRGQPRSMACVATWPTRRSSP